jgi:hypothetical protein
MGRPLQSRRRETNRTRQRERENEREGVREREKKGQLTQKKLMKINEVSLHLYKQILFARKMLPGTENKEKMNFYQQPFLKKIMQSKV